MTVRILHGDCRDVLATLPEESVHMCVTSPPYWGLRDYGVPPSVWGGGTTCSHDWGEEISKLQRRSDNGGLAFTGTGAPETRQAGLAERSFVAASQGVFCRLCGAWRGTFGLEPTYELYVAHCVEVFRAVRRVLRKDGTLWLNIGDSYATGAGKVGDCPGGGEQGDRWAGRNDSKGRGTPRRADGTGGYAYVGPLTQPNRMPQAGLKPKDLCGIPWRVAFALQEDGYYLRSDIIWSKPNPMPESVTDRPTKAHEYLFLLSKSARYFYDADAIKESRTGDEDAATFRGGCYVDGETDNGQLGKRKIVGNVRRAKDRDASARPSDTRPHHLSNFEATAGRVYGVRNKRSVWEVATQPFPEAHFATFPPALIEPCIKAGCPVNGTVLDPFAGAGTTGLVADRLQRNAILIELNPSYVAMARRRIEADAPLFTTTVEAAAE